MKNKLTVKILVYLIVASFLVMRSTMAFADEKTSVLDFLEVMVSTEGTTIILNVSSSFTYTENIEDHEIVITFENTRVNLLGEDHTRIPSFSPMFEAIEIVSNRDLNTAILNIKLANPAVKPEISITPSENILAFGFKPLNAGMLVAKTPVTLFESTEIESPPVQTVAQAEPVVDVQVEEPEKTTPESVLAQIDKPSETRLQRKFNIPAEHDQVVQIPKVHAEKVSEEVEIETPPSEIIQDTQAVETAVVEETTPIPSDIKDTQKEETPAVAITIPSVLHEPFSEHEGEQSETSDMSVEIQPLPEIEIDTKTRVEPLAKIFPDAELQAIHYSQGRVDRDVITLEFPANSPEYNYEINDSGWVILTLHNVEVPDSIMPGDEVNREVMGTLIRSISLKKFSENGMQSLQVILSCVKPIDVEITDFEGMIDISLKAQED